MNYNEFFDQNQQPDIRKMDPWEVIKSSAEGMGIKIQKPKPNCKHCYGRGYVGIRHESGEPIPCKCIFPAETVERQKQIDDEIGDLSMYRKMNRAERRKQKK